MNLNNIKEMEKYLTSDKMEEIKKNPIIEAAKIAEMAGYGAVRREILNNRRSQENFNMLIKGVNAFIGLTPEEKKTVESVKNLFIIIKDTLPLNTIKQLKYLALCQEYENITFKLAEKYKEIDVAKTREEWTEKSKGLDQYQFNFEESKNNLDNFIMNLI